MNNEPVFTTCKMCGRKLKSEQSQIHGFGPTCYAKYIRMQRKKKRLISFGDLHDTSTGGISKE